VEYKSIGFELKDMSKDSRTAVIAHAVYNNIDRTGDISHKGMFSKSWQESREDIAFYKNHNPDLTPGKTVDFWEDEQKAYTKVYLGTHTLGEDTLKMMDEGIIRKASFGYIPEKKDFTEIKGRRIRNLREVKHIETSVLTVLQANPLAKVESVTKSFDPEAIAELKQSLSVMEKFCRNTTASDESIKGILLEIEQVKFIISQYDTANTPLITEPSASRTDDERLKTLLLINSSF